MFFLTLFLFLQPAFAERTYKKKPDFKTQAVRKEKAEKDFKTKNSRGLFLKPFPVIYKPEVKRWILIFSQNHPSYMKLWLKRSYRYFPVMQKILQSQGLPKELAAMTLIESSLSPTAVSSAQAVGYWQFIKPTGLRFGLRINSWIDERQDFQKSTRAASKYLYQLYKEFGDWLLSMSAYNMGEARLRKLINKYQTKDFWLLYKKPDFPRETALYIPKVLAAVYIVKNPEFYGLNEFQILSPYKYDIFFISGGTNLQHMSSGARIPLAQLKTLNPDLKSHIIPKSISFHPMRVPKGSGLLISKWLDKNKKSN